MIIYYFFFQIIAIWVVFNFIFFSNFNLMIAKISWWIWFLGVLTAVENRGKHLNRTRKISDGSWKMAKDHRASFPHKQSHYGRKKMEGNFLTIQIWMLKYFILYLKNITSKKLARICPWNTTRIISFSVRTVNIPSDPQKLMYVIFVPNVQ